MSLDLRSPIESLEYDDVTLLLRTLREHEANLNESHADAYRLLHLDLKPLYLVDFQLLHRYSYATREDPEWVIELEYLFARDDLRFLIGPGTVLDVEQHLSEVTGGPSHLYDMLASSDELLRGPLEPRFEEVLGQLEALIAEDSPHVFALSRLTELVRRPNFAPYTYVAGKLDDPYPDNRTSRTVGAALQGIRPKKSVSNTADALNYAAVVSLRRAALRGDIRAFTYLLTATAALIHESAWAHTPGEPSSHEYLGFMSESETPITRKPRPALYSSLLLEHRSDPGDALRYTDEQLLEAARLRHELRCMPAYVEKRTDVVLEWENPEVLRSFSDPFRKKLRALADFVSDPVVSKAQRIYDVAELAHIGWHQQRGQVERQMRSASRLFDLVRLLARSIRTPEDAVSVGEMWETAIERSSTEYPSFSTITYSENGFAASPYLAVERHECDEAGDPSYFVFRWPSLADLDRVLRSCSEALMRHRVDACTLLVGTQFGMIEFDAVLPVTAADLAKELQHDESASWVRFAAEPFELLAELANPNDHRPRMGVIVEVPDIGHMADLYEATCSRFVFRPWIVAMIADSIGEG